VTDRIVGRARGDDVYASAFTVILVEANRRKDDCGTDMILVLRPWL
jgi:hypothetical protein